MGIFNLFKKKPAETSSNNIEARHHDMVLNKDMQVLTALTNRIQQMGYKVCLQENDLALLVRPEATLVVQDYTNRWKMSGNFMGVKQFIVFRKCDSHMCCGSELDI